MSGPPLPDALSMVEASKTPPSTDGPTIPPPIISPPPPFPFPFQRKMVRQGAWLVSYVPSNTTNVAYDGTIRVESQGVNRVASGDLYQRPVIILPGLPFPSPRSPRTIMMNPPDPAKGIPIQARNQYRYYLRVTQILEFMTIENSFELGLQMWKYTTAPNNAATWTNEGDYTATMSWMLPPANPAYPSASDYLEGDLKKAGIVVGRLKMGWISQFYRKITLEIDTVNGAELPLDDDAGQSWETVCQNLGFELTLDLSHTNVAERTGEGWSDAEAHAAMLANRDRDDLDNEWRYHLLAVKRLDSTPRGKMYDWNATDSNKVAREGVAIAAKWRFDANSDPSIGIPNWGPASGREFSTVKAAYFRAAVHELSHAFGISRHNTVNLGFMNTTDAIAEAGLSTPAAPFPSNILWEYADDDRKRLRHWSDMFVRPGGVVFGGAINTNLPITPDDSEIEVPQLKLELEALLTEVPLGAPVRIDVKLTNTSDGPMLAPREVGLKSACMAGYVQDPSGRVRSFHPLVHCLDSRDTAMLGAGKSISGSMTLLRGAEGALFPSSGVSSILLKASWDVGDGSAQATVAAQTTIFVTNPYTPSHAAAAHRILATPDAQLVLVLGGDYLGDGIKAIQQAVADETLGPHYAAVEAKRLVQPFRDRDADCPGARTLLADRQVVGSQRENEKLKKLFKRYGGG